MRQKTKPFLLVFFLMLLLNIKPFLVKADTNVATGSAISVISETSIERTVYLASDWTYHEESGYIMLDRYIGNDKVVNIPLEIDGKIVKKIGNQCFEGNTTITSVDLTYTNIEIIGTRAFKDCINLVEVGNLYKIKEFGHYAFENCGLYEVMLPCDLTYMLDGMFRNCQNLQSLAIPDSVYSIGNYVFYGCPNLTVYGHADAYIATYAYWNNVNFQAIDSSISACVDGIVSPPIVPNIEVTIPTILYFDIYPNETEGNRFVASDLTIENLSNVAVNVELLGIESTSSSQQTRILSHDTYKNWSTLSLSQTKKGIALGVQYNNQTYWAMNENAIDMQTPFAAFYMTENETITLSLVGKYGLVWENPLSLKYRLLYKVSQG